MAVLVVAYALSPVDLIPDVIPILGWLDGLIILPLATLLALKMISPRRHARLPAEGRSLGSEGQALHVLPL